MTIVAALLSFAAAVGAVCPAVKRASPREPVPHPHCPCCPCYPLQALNRFFFPELLFIGIFGLSWETSTQDSLTPEASDRPETGLVLLPVPVLVLLSNKSIEGDLEPP